MKNSHHLFNHLPSFLVFSVIYCVLIINHQGVLCAHYRENNNNYWHYYNSPLNQQSTQQHVETQTEYGIETIQTGTAYVNPRQRNYLPISVGPDKDQTQHYFVRVNTTTHYLPKSYQPETNGKTNEQMSLLSSSSQVLQSSLSSSLNNNNNQTHSLHPHRRHHHRRRHHRLRNSYESGECVKCPPEKIIIAQKGLDGVLIDPPKLWSCYNRPILNGLYQIETLFGSEFKFLLPHGTHSFHAKIRSKNNKAFEQTCLLRYKVIVQQCGRYYPQNDNVRVKCNPGYIWGSKCYFTCRSGYLSNSEPIICNDNLKWEGDEPECLSEPPTSTITKYRNNKSCDFIEVPENGKFSCQYPLSSQNSDNNLNDYENELTTPAGTICRVICNRNYEIPMNLLSNSVLRCEYGRWNATAQGLCRPKYRQRN